jgi:flagellar basal-body rod protein FlgC
MDVIANNIANAESTRAVDGQPYQRQQVVFRPTPAAGATLLAAKGGLARPLDEGVHVAAILRDEAPPRVVYDPGHPDADTNGYVAYPNVDVITEMTDMMSATRAYEANVTAINAAKSMATKALEITRG